MVFNFKSKEALAMALIVGSNFVIPSSFATTATSSSQTNNTQTNNQINTTKNKNLSGGVKKTAVNQHAQTWGQRHPKMKAAAVGGGLGAAAGGAAGLLTGRGVVRGAVIGAGTGAGVGVARKTAIAKRHPIASDALTGTAVGLGLGMAGGHHMAGRAALIGGAAGLGVGLWKNRDRL